MLYLYKNKVSKKQNDKVLGTFCETWNLNKRQPVGNDK